MPHEAEYLREKLRLRAQQQITRVMKEKPESETGSKLRRYPVVLDQTNDIPMGMVTMEEMTT